MPSHAGGWLEEPRVKRNGFPLLSFNPPFARMISILSSERGSLMGTILLIILVLLLLGAIPAWPYSRDWGYYPTGGIGLVLVILLILVLMGRV